MEYIGIDVHLGESKICVLTEQGEILERRIGYLERPPRVKLFLLMPACRRELRCNPCRGHRPRLQPPSFTSGIRRAAGSRSSSAGSSDTALDKG